MKDHRSRADKRRPIAMWVCATDNLMSGWWDSAHRSYAAYPIYTDTTTDHIASLVEWCRQRDDYSYTRQQSYLPREARNREVVIWPLPSKEVLEERTGK